MNHTISTFCFAKIWSLEDVMRFESIRSHLSTCRTGGLVPKLFELRKFKGNFVHFQVQPSQRELKYGNIIEICGFRSLHSWASHLPAQMYVFREKYFNIRDRLFLICAICSWDHIKYELYIKFTHRRISCPLNLLWFYIRSREKLETHILFITFSTSSLLETHK